MFVSSAAVTQLPYCLGMLPPSDPHSGDDDGSTSEDDDAPDPGVM